MADDKPKREELSPEDALRMLEARGPACGDCGAPVGRGIDRCAACIRKGPEAEALRAQIARTEQAVKTLDSGISPHQAALASLQIGPPDFVIVMLLLAVVGFLIASVGAESSHSAFLFGVAVCSVGVGSLVLRATILSALRAAAQEKEQVTTASQPPSEPPKAA